MTDTKQPEALHLAAHLENFRSFPDDIAAASELRRQHARIAELEAQLEAIGAGGVTGLRGQASVPLSVLASLPRYTVGRKGLDPQLFTISHPDGPYLRRREVLGAAMAQEGGK